MSSIELASMISELREWEELAKEAKRKADELEEAIKAEMLKRDTEELAVDKYIVRWTLVLSNRFDSTAFKKVMPDVYKAYTKQVSSRKFTISG